MESYRTLANMVTARVEEKKSVFIAVAAPASNEQTIEALLGSLRSQHRAANHHVYAYLLRETGCARCSDDGEPSQTAGMPVLGVLQHAGITDCALVVIRYFGGTLLGVGGLVRAYTAAAQAALEKAEIITLQACIPFSVTVPYPLYDAATRLCRQAGASVQTPKYSDVVTFTALLPTQMQESFASALRELCHGSVCYSIGNPLFAVLSANDS